PQRDRAFIHVILFCRTTRWRCRVRGLGLSLGIITDNLANATAWVVPILLCNVMFSGFIVTADSIPVYFVWIYYLSAFHYCFSCMMVTMFAGADLGCDSDASSTDCPFGPDGTGDDVLEFYEIEFDTYRPNMLLVWFFIGVTIVNGYALLYSRLKINLVVKNTEDAEGKTDLGFFENITRDYAIASYIFRQSRETDPLAHEPVIEVTSEGLVRRRSSRVFNPSSFKGTREHPPPPFKLGCLGLRACLWEKEEGGIERGKEEEE
ncbi:hypothetical protein CYMTET_33565, partial [Cymbomonas tetramitiformis]